MTTAAAVVPGTDGIVRCWWCAGDPLYEAYHDREWGRPRRDERGLFEKLALEGFQAGLSWRLVLHRREALRAAFAGFDPDRLAGWDEAMVERLMAAPGMLRHRGKIAAVLHNARVVRAIRAETGDFAAFLWRHRPRPEPPPPRRRADLAAVHPAAIALARALRARGWRFLGPVSAWAFMQAVGMVNAHVVDCPWRAEVAAARRCGPGAGGEAEPCGG